MSPLKTSRGHKPYPLSRYKMCPLNHLSGSKTCPLSGDKMAALNAERTTEKIKKKRKVKKDLPVGETVNRLAGTTLLEVTETAAQIFVPNRTVAVWLERRLYGQITKAIKGVVGRDVDLQFVTSPR